MIFRCKNCGGNVVYSPERKKMFCPFCESEDSEEREDGVIETSGEENGTAEGTVQAAGAGQPVSRMVAAEGAAQKKVTKVCPNCGGEIPMTVNTSATPVSYTHLDVYKRQVATPYLIISDEMTRELGLAAKRGVDVRVFTPGIPDKKIIYGVTRSYYSGLVRQGVRVYEYTPGFLHAKQMLCDGDTATVGTINMDYRSLYHHFENGVWMHGCDAIRDIEADFDKLLQDSEEVTDKYRDGRKNMAVRGWQCIMRLIAPLL